MRADRETKEKNSRNRAGRLFPSLIIFFTHDNQIIWQINYIFPSLCLINLVMHTAQIDFSLNLNLLEAKFHMKGHIPVLIHIYTHEQIGLH